MHFLLYSKPTCTTGKQLVTALGIRGGSSFPEDGERPESLIRWGSTAKVPYRPSVHLLNGRNAVAAATDKLGSLRDMRGSGVPVPVVYTPEQASALQGGFPVLGRNMNHTQGRDIQICFQRADVVRTMNSATPPDFFTRYIPTDREFRVHVFDGKVLKISEKVLTEPEKFQSPWIRNFENGYTFRNIRTVLPVVLQRIEFVSILAVQALGLHFGAADVVLSDAGEVVVLEVNTGPSLADNSLRAYVVAIATFIGIPEEELQFPDDTPEEVMDEEFDEQILDAMV